MSKNLTNTNISFPSSFMQVFYPIYSSYRYLPLLFLSKRETSIRCTIQFPIKFHIKKLHCKCLYFFLGQLKFLQGQYVIWRCSGSAHFSLECLILLGKRSNFVINDVDNAATLMKSLNIATVTELTTSYSIFETNVIWIG